MSKTVPVLLQTAMVIAATAVCGSERTEPLNNVKAYTTEITQAGPTCDYFPVGLLNKQKDKLMLIRAGFNYNEYGSISNYSWKDGAPMFSADDIDPNGTLELQPIWGMITLSFNNKTKKFGTLRIAKDHNGKLRPRRCASLFEPNFIEFITSYDAEAAEVRGKAVGRNALVFWSLDNEWEGHLDYSKPVITKFHQWLKTIFGSIDKLNATYKTKYKDFSEIVPPAPATHFKENHGLWLDWHKFQRDNFTEVIYQRCKAVSENDPLHRPVVLKSTQLCNELPAKSKTNLVDAEMLSERIRKFSGGYYGVDIYGADDKISYNLNYLFNCIRTNDGTPGYGIMLCESNNHSSPGYQWASTYWRSLNNGLKAVNFFCSGFPGATGDFDTYAFIGPDLKIRDRFFYAMRWAHMLHRTEAFWTQSIPAAGMPKLAMLVPRRDILLADNSELSMWEWSKNNRLKIYGWLRSQGFWIDLVPYTKLSNKYLKNYQGLILIGTEHLTATECDTVKQYIKNGGKLVSDTRPGFYNEHHAESRGLESVLGAQLKSYNNYSADLWLATENGIIRGDGIARVKLTTGKAIFKTTRKQAAVIKNIYGKGESLYIATQLGVLRPETVEPMLISGWLKKELAEIGLFPAYRLKPCSISQQALRATQPYVDKKGNCIFAVSNLSKKPFKASTLELWLPEGIPANALWAPAENDGISPLKVKKSATGSYLIDLPEFKTAGMIYLLKNHKVVLGIPQIKSEQRSIDGAGAAFAPGASFNVTVQIFAPEASQAGTLELKALNDWKVSPERIKVPPLKTGKIYKYNFKVTTPNESKNYIPQQLYPLVTTWSSGKEKSVISANVEIIIPEKMRNKIPHCLSGNQRYSNGSILGIQTNATYQYEVPENSKGYWKDPASGKRNSTGNALRNGIRNWGSRFATYNLPEIDIVFDLKKAYNVSKIKIYSLRQKQLAPKDVKISLSTNGKEYHKTASSTSFNRGVMQIEMSPEQARYVKISATFSNPKGMINEIEIWGTK